MNHSSILYRQVHPNWYQDSEVTSQLFKPTTKDKGLVSVYDSELISAEDSWKHHTIELELESIGVLAASVAECESLELPIEPDPDPHPAHAHIVFKDLTRGEMNKKAKLLKQNAVDRDWQYISEDYEDFLS